MESKITFVHTNDDWDMLSQLIRVYYKLGVNINTEIIKCRINDNDSDSITYNSFTWVSPPEHI